MAKKGNAMLDRGRQHEGKAGGGLKQTDGKSLIKTANQNPSTYSPFHKGK